MPCRVSLHVFGTRNYDAGLDLLQTSDGDLVVGGADFDVFVRFMAPDAY